MTRDEYASWLSWFETYVRGFAGDDGVLCPPLELKRLHSLRVSDNAHRIARDLGLAGAEIELARVAGLLHDVGRFTQFSRHGSFSDADTVDHGQEGRAILEQAPSRLFTSSRSREHLVAAVGYHNRRTDDIPAELEPSQLALLRVVRDADKIDIMEIVLGSVEENGFRELPSMLPGLRLSRQVGPAVLARAVSREPLLVKDLATLGDFLLLISTWFHDLNYAPARRLAAARGYLLRLRQALPDTNGLSRYFDGLAEAYRLPLLSERPCPPIRSPLDTRS